MRVFRNVLSSALVLALVTTACAHAPEARRDDSRQEPVDIAGIGPRPKVFGRHAWDAAQKRAAARQAQAAAKAPPAPTTPAPAVAVAPPQPAPVTPAAPAPVTPATPPAPVVAAVPPAAATAAPTPAAPPAAPQVAVVTSPAAHAPAMPASPPRPVAAASAPAPSITISTPALAPAERPKKTAKKAPGLWERITTPPPEPPVVAGGYGPARDKAAVAAAAAFAVHESPGYVLKDVYSAKVQVVAGTNYSLCLWVRRPTLEPNPLHRRMVAATVFQGLDQHYELISWKEVENCHAGTPPQ